VDASAAILVLTPAAEATARRVAAALPGATLHGLAHRVPGLDASFAETLNHIRTLYQAGTPIIGVCASGILIRALAAVISDKRLEPPVLAISEDGASVIPLLGGHRGANSLARQIADALDGHAAITTAGDTALGIALDSPPAGWWLANPEHAKGFMAELLAGSAVRIEGDADWISRSRLAISDKADLTIALTEERRAPDDRTLVYHPRRLVVGVGCARGCDPQELAALVRETLRDEGLAEGAVALVATLDLKADEPAMNALADALKVPLRVFDAETLEAETPRLQTPSEVVFAEVGCHGVSEGAALAAVGEEGRLRVAKRKTANATVAVAEAPAPLKPSEVGRARGRLSVIGIGPGRDDWRTPQSSRLLAEADEIVGYSLYLDLVAPLIQGKPRHAFPLGAEEERVRFALERAGEGRSVALVSSGDAGIYAMGALVFELLDRPVTDGGVSDAARRIEVINAPGISALQAVSALIGAPLGHDFCTISLSDLLTPWEAIEQRLKAAAEGDFVIAFYNPVSRRRRTQLAAAREILLAHRPADTPVVLGVNLGREGETVRVTTLEALTVDEVDMLTTVLVGSSASRAVMTGAGKPFVYTPRGYAKRIEEKL
jgi:cobalt-precorrin 5A hydrolase/precorrin-3B C17-methyltransferase